MTAAGFPSSAAAACRADRILHIKEVSEMTSIPENTLRYYHQLSKADPPQYVGPRAVKIGKRLCWKESQVLAWLDEVFAEAQ
ncbi:helix-turn-helix transcriptional regulator [Nocardioides sp. J54]|uniref:helix-turn-helix transcriptional regulator n=1 Tax=Nocardioides sp. J54 TaxID=935866 RepID=UPI000490CBBB|nr:hypothetical protein [Nocardioides sp. J54]